MDRNRVTVRYAKALIDLANEQNLLDEVNNDMLLLYTALDEYKGFYEYVINPGFASSEKYKKINALFSKDFNALSMRFVQLVFDNNREEYLKDLCRNIIAMAREIKGIVPANITTAKTVDEKLITKLKTKFEKELKTSLELSTEVNEELIGGFIFTIDNQQYDASVSTKINAIKKEFQL